MDPKELEEKLERDNLTLKEHIFKLQNTIKQIKTEILTGDKEHETYLTNKNLSVGKNNSKDLDDQISNLNRNLVNDDNHLKFSFNNKNNQVTDSKSITSLTNENLIKLKSNSYSPNNPTGEKDFNIENNKIKKNIYQENFHRIRKEKEILEKMETVKKKANLKKNFDDEDIDQDEINRFHKNYNTIKSNKHNRLNNDYTNPNDEIKMKNSKFFINS